MPADVADTKSQLRGFEINTPTPDFRPEEH